MQRLPAPSAGGVPPIIQPQQQQQQHLAPGSSVQRYPVAVATGSSSSSSTPIPGGSRRTFAGPLTSGAMLGRSQHQQPQKKKRKFGDKLIPPEVRELIPESQAYMDLLAFEQKLDATITRKKLDIQEALKRPQKVKRRLRIYVSHTFYAGKEPETPGGEDGVNAVWELRVEGKLLDEEPQPPQPQQPVPPASKPNKRKFSGFFKSLVIELDKDIYGPDNHLVEWHRRPDTNETDGFQVKRPGSKNVKCTILLLLDYQPMKYKLHPRLAKVLGIGTETRPKIIEALWQYIKTHKLQDSNERDYINCDQYLEGIFGCHRMRFMEIPQRLQPLLSQPDPIVINHTISVEGPNPKATACYDIDVEIEDPLKQQMSNFISSNPNANELNHLDQKLYDFVEQITEGKTRRDFYMSFADDPVEFIQKWLVSQSKDLKTMTECGETSEAERKSVYYHQPYVEEAVHRYIYNKVQQKRLELEQSLGVKNN